VYEQNLESNNSCSCGDNSRISLQEARMKENDVEELAKSVGTLVEKILKLVLSKDDEPEDKGDDAD